MATTHFESIGFMKLFPSATAATPGTTEPGNTTMPQIFVTDGSPNTKLTAPKGSIALSINGSGTTDRVFVNTDGGTTWTSITTAA